MGLTHGELGSNATPGVTDALIERFLGTALARTTEVLAPYMPSGSNAGNGHVRTERASAVPQTAWLAGPMSARQKRPITLERA
jgi:hypothetical protein